VHVLPSEHVAPLATHMLAWQQPPATQVLPAQQGSLEWPQITVGPSGATSLAEPGASTLASSTTILPFRWSRQRHFPQLHRRGR